MTTQDTGADTTPRAKVIYRTQQYYIRCQNLRSRRKWIPVQGYPVIIPGFEKFDTFISPRLNARDEQFAERDWIISDGKSGNEVDTKGKYTTIKDAANALVTCATNQPNVYNAERYARLLEERVRQQYGVSPRFRKRTAFKCDICGIPITKKGTVLKESKRLCCRCSQIGG